MPAVCIIRAAKQKEVMYQKIADWEKIIACKRILLVSFVCVALAGSSGCFSPLALQAVGAAGSTSPVAYRSLGHGKTESFWLARYDDVIRATGRAADALSLQLKEKKIEKNRTQFQYSDDTGEKLDILIERRSATMTSIRFDVGWTGSVAFAHLMGRQIVFELNKAGAFLEDWTPLSPK